MSKPIWSKTALAQAIGIAVAGTGTAAHAAELLPSITYTNAHSTFHTDDFAGAYNTPGLDEGSTATLKLTIPTGNNWDVGIGFARTKIDDQKDTAIMGPYQESTELKDNYKTIDFEAGYNSTLGIAKSRLSAGLRYIDLEQKIAESFTYSPTGYSVTKYKAINDSKALGLHVGGELSVPFGKGFSASGALGASVLYADREARFEAKYGPSSSVDENDTVYGAEAELALNYTTKGGVTVSAGVTSSIMHDFVVMDLSNDTSDLSQEGWFVRVGSTFE